MAVAALLVLVGLVLAPSWILRRVSPSSASPSSAAPARGRAARAATQPETGDSARRTRRAWRALLLLAALLLVFAWAVGQVDEEARTYAEVHAMPGNDGEPEGALRAAVLACAAVLLVGAGLLRPALGARRRDD